MRRSGTAHGKGAPVDGPCDGIGFDGKHLWALDAANKRICMIEKSKTGPKGVH